jgi:hypothetical protein
MARAAKKSQPAGAGHNAQSEREQWEEQQFLNGFRQIKGIRSDIAGSMGDAATIYARLKKAGGFTKGDVKWAMELEDKDAAEVIATMRRRIRIAKMLGHGVARQIEMFDEDRTPAEDRAYEDGLAAGKLRKMNANPHAGGAFGDHWQRGFNEGTAFANRELADQFPEDEAGEEGDADPFPAAAE